MVFIKKLYGKNEMFYFAENLILILKVTNHKAKIKLGLRKSNQMLQKQNVDVPRNLSKHCVFIRPHLNQASRKQSSLFYLVCLFKLIENTAFQRTLPVTLHKNQV